jgi:Asp-tRNA(Asn)/Glu-tRNA(Gln) amidotransferase A subunit family amidase
MSSQSSRQDFKLLETTIADIHAAYQAGTLTVRGLVQSYLDRIAAYDQKGPAINSLISLNPTALEEADRLDAAFKLSGFVGPLHGIPVIMKDQGDVKGMPTTLGSVLFKDYMPRNDAFVVAKLRKAGVVFLGKATLGELGGGDTHGSLFGSTRNVYDLERTAGGSSGGSGASVSANFCTVAIGQEGFASIRRPSTWNGVAGMRPTMGLVSRSGVYGGWPTVNGSLGPMARTVTDLAKLLDCMVGYDPDDPVTKLGAGRRPASYARGLDRHALRGAKLGVFVALFGDTSDDRRAGSVARTAVSEMQSAGARMVDVQPADVATEADGVAIIRFEFKFDLDDYLRRTPRAPVRSLTEMLDQHLVLPALEPSFRRSEAVTTLDSDDYRAVVARNARLRDALIEAMDRAGVTALVYPTLRRTAAKIGEPQAGGNCASSAATGLPAITVPAGFADDGMPVGIELLGRPFSEGDLLTLAYAYEQATHHRHASPLTP